MSKSKNVKSAAQRTGSEGAKAALLRGGAGKHDTRPRGERDRAGQRRAWQNDQAA